MTKIFQLLTLIFIVGIYSTTFSQTIHDHSIWNNLTKKYVSVDGKVNYKGFKKDVARLDEYLTELSQNHPQKSWSKENQLAFWINAYNAFTVKLIVKNYPVKSIKELGGGIYKVNTPWDIKFIRIGNETYDLNNIEHGIIRKEFNEPRIHFAVNCAAQSCPKLRNEAYIGSKLDAQLTDQTQSFLRDTKKNKISSNKVELSKLFKWYSGDFKQGTSSVLAFINKYAPAPISDKAEISYLPYNWNLNE